MPSPCIETAGDAAVTCATGGPAIWAMNIEEANRWSEIEGDRRVRGRDRQSDLAHRRRGRRARRVVEVDVDLLREKERAEEVDANAILRTPFDSGAREGPREVRVLRVGPGARRVCEVDRVPRVE